ncbi:MAG TPA: sugar transferase [Synergistaceae bacterium]|nr:sugar transferase [Synergistaceae bacterium]
MDIFGALFGLIFLSPLFLITGLLVKSKLGTPVIFRQERAGKNGKPFIICKFRTMTDERNEDGNLLPDEKRLARFGAFLRSTSIDELPELWNVLKGEMSLVGPRPLHIRYIERYSAEQKRRLEIRPGMTGWAQVNGRNALSWEDRFKMDVWYVDNRNLWLDIRILLLTMLKVFKREGISGKNHPTMEEFDGSDWII